MKIYDILNESRVESQDFLNESIVYKKKKYFIVKNNDNKETLPGTKEEGYASIENAVRSMFTNTNDDFKKLSFEAKSDKVNKYVRKWFKDNNKEQDSKPEQVNGFYKIDFSQE